MEIDEAKWNPKQNGIEPKRNQKDGLACDFAFQVHLAPLNEIIFMMILHDPCSNLQQPSWDCHRFAHTMPGSLGNRFSSACAWVSEANSMTTWPCPMSPMEVSDSRRNHRSVRYHTFCRRYWNSSISHQIAHWVCPKNLAKRQNPTVGTANFGKNGIYLSINLPYFRANPGRIIGKISNFSIPYSPILRLVYH